jgi:hypothetical protein
LGEHYSEGELMKYDTTHKSNKAFRQYMQKKKDKSLQIYQTAQK